MSNSPAAAENIMSEIFSVLAKTLSLSVDDIHQQSSLATLKGWDSLNHIRVISAVEDHFKIQFTGSELVELDNVEKLANAVTRKKI